MKAGFEFGCLDRRTKVVVDCDPDHGGIRKRKKDATVNIAKVISMPIIDIDGNHKRIVLHAAELEAEERI